MRLQRGYQALLAVVLALATISPLAAAFATRPDELIYLASVLSFVGWVVALSLFARNAQVTARLQRILKAKPSSHWDPAQPVIVRAREMEREYRAMFAVRNEESVLKRNLEFQLQRLLTSVYEEFSATSAEISLFDEHTRRWSRAFLVGVPRSRESQSMIAGDEKDLRLSFSTGVLRTDLNDAKVLITPIRFAGVQFGELRIELIAGAEISDHDEQVAELFGMQCAHVLANCNFTEELYRLKQKNEESVQAKTGFLANLSHEIRGPLGIILNGTELALDGLCGPTTDQMRETLTMIKSSGSHLLDLVNDVLDYAKVEAGKITAKGVEIEVKGLLDDLTSVVRTQAVAKHHKLILHPVDKDLGVFCDKRHARQMLINFLTNAIKYTPDGGQIQVRAERSVGNRVKISIQDSGIGIPEEQRSKVFGAFERVDNKYALQQVGTGLGMPLTKKLAEANGGHVDFESEDGKGSTFWLILPVADIPQANAASAERDSAGGVAQGRGDHILIVDHDHESRQMLATYLTHQGFNVHAVATGREVIKHLKTGVVDVAIVENDMPDISGEEMVQAIRAHPKAALVPVVLLSSRAFVFDIERFLKLGVDRCLSKPVELSELAFTARRLIDEVRRHSNVDSHP